jgi:tetratricopeptide (TPR) repeat protein
LEADRVIGEYRKALPFNPNNVEAHQKLGFLLGRVKDRPQEDMIHLPKTIALEPHNARAHHDLAMILLRQRQLDEASGHVKEALEYCQRLEQAARQ